MTQEQIDYINKKETEGKTLPISIELAEDYVKAHGIEEMKKSMFTVRQPEKKA